MTPLHLVIVVFFVLYSLETKESDAQSLVFVQQGNNALLDLTTSPGQYKFFFWKFNGDNNVVSLANGQNPDISNRYKEKAEFKQNYSLLLKNLQQTDSGDYVALASGDTDVQLAKYNVIVKDPVSPVKLTVTSNSSDPCNLTVTCSTVDSHITKTYRCDKLTCSYQGGANDDSINVTVREGVIICNHSNQVSWKTDRIEINSICVSHLGIPNEATTIGIVTGVLAAGLLLALCIYFKCKRPIEPKSNENTIYAVPEDIVPAQTHIQTPAADVSTVSPTSTYALVQFPSGHGKSNTINTPLPETVYVQVERPAKLKTTQ